MGLFGTIGAVGGGALGASFGGPVGAVIGSGIGGYVGGQLDPNTDMPNDSISPAILAQQQQLAQQLQLQALGQGPNPAMQQMRLANDQNIRQSAGFVASQKGINPALAGRLAAQNQAMMAQKNNADMGIMSANQQLQSQQVLGNLLTGQRNSQLQNQQLQLQNQQLNNNRNSQMFGGLINGAGAYLGQKYASNPNAANTPKQLSEGQQDSVNGYEDSRNEGFAQGGAVPGTANVSGDSKENDTVPAMLSPGEIVIPRSHSKNPELAKKFIDQLHGVKPKETDEIDIAEVMKINKQLKKRVDALEKKVGK